MISQNYANTITNTFPADSERVKWPARLATLFRFPTIRG